MHINIKIKISFVLYATAYTLLFQVRKNVLHFCKIHGIYGGEDHFGDALIVCAGIIHTILIIVNRSYYFN
jgi:hypothetical protein